MKKKLTITEEQKKYILDNYKKMTYAKLASNMGITYSRIKDQIWLMRLTKIRTPEVSKKIELSEMFDWDEFSKTDNCLFNTRIRKV
jgi:hypothetical protein